MKHKLFKIGAAAAITVGGVTAASSLKTVSASTFKTALKRVKINYLPGQGVRIWTSYNGGRFMGFRAKEGTEWNVVKTATDKKGNLWYMVGDDEWIPARYTVDVPQTTASVKTKKAKKSKLSTLAAKARATVKKIKPVKTTAVQQAQEKAEAKKESKLQTKKENVAKAKAIVAKAMSANTSQAPSKAAAVVNLVKQEVGKPYVWGGTGPDSFDCSGLVQYVYAKAGINLPRTTYDQVKVGQTVSMSNLQPGDLLFWGSPTAPYHVAIYIGNNQYVNAATPQQGTILQNISSYYYPTIAKRVL